MIMQSFRDSGSRKSIAAKLWIRREFARSCWRAFPAIGAGVAQTAMTITQAFCAAALMTNVIHPGTILLAPFILAFISAGFMRSILMLWQDQIATSLGISARRRLRSNALTNLIGAGPTRLRGRHAAELTDIIVDEIESIGQVYSRWIPAIALAVVEPRSPDRGLSTRRSVNRRTRSARIDAFDWNTEPIDGARCGPVFRAALTSACRCRPHHGHRKALSDGRFRLWT